MDKPVDYVCKIESRRTTIPSQTCARSVFSSSSYLASYYYDYHHYHHDTPTTITAANTAAIGTDTAIYR